MTLTAEQFAMLRDEPGSCELVRGEILSPSDRLSAVNSKVREWLAAGTIVAVIVDPVHEAVFIHRAGKSVEILTGDHALRAEDVLPGFALALPDLFAP